MRVDAQERGTAAHCDMLNSHDATHGRPRLLLPTHWLSFPALDCNVIEFLGDLVRCADTHWRSP